MMLRGQALFRAVALLFFCASLAATAQPTAGMLKVSGVFAQGAGKSVFRLDLTYEAELSQGAGQALLVFAEPSHSLLLAHIDPSFQGGNEFQEALALMRGPADAFRHSVTLPFHPLTDQRILVVLKDNNGGERVVADALVNLHKFDFSTSFEGDLLSATAKYHHCCHGPRCAEMCVDCDTPDFTCDLIYCDIQCGHDSSWPPKV